MLDGYDKYDEWPPDAEEMYERIEELGRGSYGVVWMARRRVDPEDEFDDEYVALKNIEIKSQKSYIYASREISILRELRHPCVIRLIRAFPIWEESSQLVALQLARGPDLQYLVTNRGALGLPFARLVSRHLISAVSYLHGRAVIHRDIKPTNCIMHLENFRHDQVYDWLDDDLIWSDGPEAEEAVASNKWRLMLVDFGFARALGESELGPKKKHGRHSILNESLCIEEVAEIAARELEDEKELEKISAELRNGIEEAPALIKSKKRLSMISVNLQELDAVVDDPDESSNTPLPTLLSTPERATKAETISTPDSIPEDSEVPSGNGAPRAGDLRATLGRQSSARTKVRAMSALGTKAYAAPEIKNDLRNKTEDDMEMSRAALTECVADYGMIVDAYSVGWTIRVVLTGVPPNQTVSSYLEKVEAQKYSRDGGSLCCCGSKPEEEEPLRLRDISELPKEAAHLINSLTKRNAEDRMTVREAQSHPYIKGTSDEEPYQLPAGDIPAKHGDPVVPLKCSLK